MTRIGPTALRKLMAPESVAVVGASPTGSRGTVVLENMRRLGYGGRLHAVHPTADEVAGVPCYPSLIDLPEPVEFVVAAVRAESVPAVLREAAASGAGAGLVIAAGFEEGNASGRERAAEVATICREGDLAVCGPNCYGIFDAHSGFAAYSGPIVNPLRPGSVGFILQSGALTHAVHDPGIGRGLGISTVVTSGNETVVRIGDYLRWMVEDDNTRVIGVFVEQIRDADTFAEAARGAAAAGKPVVALKAGRTAGGRRATLAHTGAVSGSDEAYRAFFTRHGVAQVDDVDEFREALLLYSGAPKPAAARIVVVALSGGVSGLVADLADSLGHPLPELSAHTRERLAAVLPPFAHPSNPLDMTGAAAERPDILRDVATVLLESGEVDALAVAFNVAQRSEGQRELHRTQARILAGLRADAEAPLVAFSVASGPMDPEVQRTLAAAGVPNLVGAREALVALRSWAGAGSHRPGATVPPVGREERALPMTLSGSDAIALVEDAGFTVPAWRRAGTVEQAVEAATAIGFPVAVKVDSPEITHKSDVGGVVLDVRDASGVAAAAARALEAGRDFASAGLLVQGMAPPGLECLLGVTRDPDLGLQMVFSPGGVLVELFDAAVTRPLPIGPDEAEDLIAASPLASVIDGYRGGDKADRKALIEALCRLSDLALEFGENLDAIDVNPFVLLGEGAGGVVVDAVFVPSRKGRDDPL